VGSIMLWNGAMAATPELNVAENVKTARLRIDSVKGDQSGLRLSLGRRQIVQTDPERFALAWSCRGRDRSE